MSENQKKSVFELPKMVTDDPKGNFEVMLNLVYGKDGRSYIRYSEDGTDGMPITDLRLEFDAWHHEDGKWFIYGTCVYCGAKWRGISFTDSCAKELKDVMDREG